MTIEIKYCPIGIIKSPFKEIDGMPIQPLGAGGIRGEAEIFPEYEKGLQDIDGYSHLILIYHLHLCKGMELLIKPFLEDKLHGVFSTRAPNRPNPIGISVVKLVSVQANRLIIEDVDILDQTPLLDIKPFVSSFDNRYETKDGWLTARQLEARTKRSDTRFR
ncbi:MAG: tRNA (N6-threonylcarbamoyladenosine(37)-N6)-methyltransferase TrmO [Pseudomonadota bacterium]